VIDLLRPRVAPNWGTLQNQSGTLRRRSYLFYGKADGYLCAACHDSVDLAERAKLLILLVGVQGFEPWTR
jgi:hypothetical protein